jgi:hypothetical protein
MMDYKVAWKELTDMIREEVSSTYGWCEGTEGEGKFWAYRDMEELVDKLEQTKVPVVCPKCGGDKFVFEDSTWSTTRKNYTSLYRCWGTINDVPCRGHVIIEGPKSRHNVGTVELEPGEHLWEDSESKKTELPIDPVGVFYRTGWAGLSDILSRLSRDDLILIVREMNLDPSQQSYGWKSKKRLINLIVGQIRALTDRSVKK